MKHPDILKQLTLEQKVALLSGKDVWSTYAFPQAGVPSMVMSDGPHGLRRQLGRGDHLGQRPSQPATCFPTAACLAGSWDPALLEEVGRALGTEAAAQGVHMLLGPGMNLKRSPLGGRNFEYFSEDPYLSGKLSAALVRGVQSQGAAACIKHFAANSQELLRMTSDSVVDERTFRELYLTGFEIAVKEGRPLGVMSSYNRVNGAYANENPHLLTEILREEWGFDGIVVTDWGACNRQVDGLKAGSNLEMPGTQGDSDREVLKALDRGEISLDVIDRRVDELLDVVLATTEAARTAPKHFDEGAHHALARRAAAESAVLLKNEDSLLPLAPGTRVAVLGDLALEPRYQGAGSSLVRPTRLDRPLDCLKESGLKVIGHAKAYRRNGQPSERLEREAAELARQAEAVILFLGIPECFESEGLDRDHLALIPIDRPVAELQQLAHQDPGGARRDDVLIHLQQRELPFQPPLFAAGRELLRHLDGKPVGVLLHRHREIAEIGLCLNAAGKAGQAIRLALRAQQQAQQGGLSPAVASGQAQPPVGVQRGGKLLKNRLITALIAKGQVG